MIKQISKKSLEKGTQKTKKKLVSAEKNEKSRKSLKKKTKKSIVPRTCRDSPVNLPLKKPLTRMASLDLGKPGKVEKKSIKKKLSIQTLKKTSKPFGKDDQVENLMSPIKKVKQNFINPDETSLLSVLDILASN
jgi:hypothetical protein